MTKSRSEAQFIGDEPEFSATGICRMGCYNTCSESVLVLEGALLSSRVLGGDDTGLKCLVLCVILSSSMTSDCSVVRHSICENFTISLCHQHATPEC